MSLQCSLVGWCAGTTQLHVDLERMVAHFVGQEDAITFGMGFATNSIIIPALVGKECLVLSDSLNHASIVTGVRGSGAKVKVMWHQLLCMHCTLSAKLQVASIRLFVCHQQHVRILLYGFLRSMTASSMNDMIHTAICLMRVLLCLSHVLCRSLRSCEPMQPSATTGWSQMKLHGDTVLVIMKQI